MLHPRFVHVIWLLGLVYLNIPASVAYARFAWNLLTSDGFHTSDARHLSDAVPQFLAAPAPGSAASENTATFLVVGDWGRSYPETNENQTLVAAAMGTAADSLAPAFVISTGDNFYPCGLQGPDDPAFEATFSNVYDPSVLNLPYYLVLGNHDYCDGGCINMPSSAGPLNQLGDAGKAQDQRWNMPNRTYELLVANGTLAILFIDTTPAVEVYRLTQMMDITGGIATQDWSAQLQQISDTLASPPFRDAAWRVVVGHHPVYSNSGHGNTPELRKQLEPVLKENGVHLYLSGHDHDMEHIQKDDVHYVISGGGSDIDPTYNQRNNNSVWHANSIGFASVSSSPDSLDVDLWVSDGDTIGVLHSFSISRSDEAEEGQGPAQSVLVV